jgi:hypothetical protein
MASNTATLKQIEVAKRILNDKDWTANQFAEYKGKVYTSFEEAYWARQLDEGDQFNSPIRLLGHKEYVSLLDFEECSLPE